MFRDFDIHSMMINYTPLEMWQMSKIIFSNFRELEKLGGLKKKLSHLEGNILHLISDKDSVFAYDYQIRLNDLCIISSDKNGNIQHKYQVSDTLNKIVSAGLGKDGMIVNNPTDIRQINCKERKRLEVITSHIPKDKRKTLYKIWDWVDDAYESRHTSGYFHSSDKLYGDVRSLEARGLLYAYTNSNAVLNVNKKSNENFGELVSICKYRDQFEKDKLSQKESEALQFFFNHNLNKMAQPNWRFMDTSFGQDEFGTLISKGYLLMDEKKQYSLSEKGKALKWLNELPPPPSFIYSIRSEMMNDFSKDERISEMIEGNDKQNTLFYLETKITAWISKEFKIRYKNESEENKSFWKLLIQTYKQYKTLLAKEIYRDLKQPIPIKKTKLSKRKSIMKSKGLTPKKAYDTNKAIEKMIDKNGMDPQKYSSDAKMFIAQYTGYGGLHTFLNTEESHSGILYEYYTPDPIIKKMWGLALRYGFNGGHVLEPAAGIGSFIGLAPNDRKLSKRISFTAIEPQEYSFRILNILYPEVRTKKRVFEQEFIASNQSLKGNVKQEYDLVIGNPPYGSISGTGGGRYFSMGENTYSKAKSYDEYFILRGLDVLKSEGLLIYIIGSEVAAGGVPMLQKKQTKTKEMIADRAELIDAYRLPNGVFDRTDVLSDILVFKKK